jgi:hypothetical protein
MRNMTDHGDLQLCFLPLCMSHTHFTELRNATNNVCSCSATDDTVLNVATALFVSSELHNSTLCNIFRVIISFNIQSPGLKKKEELSTLERALSHTK